MARRLVLAALLIAHILATLCAGDSSGKSLGRVGFWAAGLLGILFARSFCPVSAALFFGSLLPLAVKSGPGASRE